MLEPFLGGSEFANHGQRVVEGQRLTQAASDIMLGWIRAENPLDQVKRDFYVRQLWDAKGSPVVEVMEPDMMAAFARLCGTELATALRSPAPITACFTRWHGCDQALEEVDVTKG